MSHPCSSVRPSPSTQRPKRITHQLIRSDNEKRRPICVWDVDYPQISTASRLSQCDPRPVRSVAVFKRTSEDFLNLLFRNGMSMDVRLPSFWIHVKPQFHD